MTIRSVVVFVVSVLAVAGAASSLAAQTREYLDAPTVESRVRVQWDPSRKQMTYAVDDDTTFRGLGEDALFLTKSSIFITYPRLNPLRIDATTSVTAVDDPSHATIAKLIEGIVSVATTVGPDISGLTMDAVGCAEIVALSSSLNDPRIEASELRGHVTRWTEAIDQGFQTQSSGADGIRRAIGLINADLESTEPGLLAVLDGIIKAATPLVESIERNASSPPPNCEQVNYGLALLTNPRARIQQLQALRAAVAQVEELLRTKYASDLKWDGFDFIISEEIRPTVEKMRNVKVKVTSVSLTFDDVSGALAIARQEAGSAELTVRRYSSFAPEVGIGPVFGFIEKPKYGTGQNEAGETVVASVPVEKVSIDPSILVNFVCRCAAGPLQPMAQVGAVASKETPGILIGGGLRLFGAGKGDIAIGGGLMLAWVKDLKTLAVGDPVSGTKDIEADLGFESTPRTVGYFVIQYKF